MLCEFKAQVEKLAVPVIEGLGLEFVDLSVVKRQGTYSIEILIDIPGGGIGLEQCSLVNRSLTEVFDVQPWANDYELVVASPGLDRLLKTEKDFRRLLNKSVRILLKEKVDGKCEYVGLIKEVSAGYVLIALKAKDVMVPLDKIMKAVQAI